MAVRCLDEVRMRCMKIAETHDECVFERLVREMRDDDSNFLFADFDTANYCIVYTEDRVYIACEYQTATVTGLRWVSSERNPVE